MHRCVMREGMNEEEGSKEGGVDGDAGWFVCTADDRINNVYC